MLRVSEVLLTEFPLLGLKLQLASDGILLCRQLYVIGRAVVLLLVLTNEIGEPVPVTVIGTEAVAPGATEKVAPVDAMVKVWLVAVTARLTVVVVVGELMGVMVMFCALAGTVMLANVEIVNTVVA
jgi:hypothetical protein